MTRSSFITHPSSYPSSVLIVEDDAILAIHLRNMLVGLGYTVPDPVATGEEAITVVAAATPNLVLMDIHLAGAMDGITAAERIRSSADVPIVFLTSYSQDPLVQRAKMTAPYGYLIKPVPQRELAATVDLAIYRHALDRRLQESEERYRRLFEQASDGIFLIDGQGHLIDVNEAACQLLGHTREEMLQKAVSDLAWNVPIQSLQREEEHHGKELLIEQETVKKDGTPVTIEIKVTQLSDGRIQGIFRDITLRKLEEAALKKTHDELERRVQARTADLLSANESLNREIEDRRKREEILRVSFWVSEFSGAHSLEELLKKALDEIQRLTGSRIGFFHFLKEDEQTLSLQSWSTSTLETFFTAEGKGRYYDVNETGVWEECLRQRRPVIRNELTGTPGRIPITRELVVPIVRGEKIVAILGVGNKDHDYDSRDIETVMNLANMTWDVVLRKQAEQQMYNSLATLTMVIDGISDPLIMFDAKRRVKRLNRAARDYYGLASYQEAVNKLCHEAFRGKSSPCEDCAHPLSDIYGYSGHYERKGANDPERIEQVFVDLARDEAGAPKAYIVRIHDVTQERMMERHLIQNEKLSSLGLLIAGIAHKINNPNNFIFFNTPILRSYLEFLLPFVDEYVSEHPDLLAFGRPYPVFREDCFKLLDNIEHGSTRINQIVGNLREFVYDRGKSLLRQTDLKQVVEKGISICRGRMKKTVKSFEVAIPENLPMLLTDPLAIEQVVVNLLINAAQAADKDDSWVKLAILGPDTPEGDIIVEVSDNGCGMDSETQKKVFDPFFTTKAVGVGTGLGLSISHRLVTELGGRIEVRSEAGKGSCFRVRLNTTLS